jgi:general secretion pathway protein G
VADFLHRRRRGFTLIELLVVVTIIGVIATIIIPMFLDALQKGKQKRTMAEVRLVGTCWMSWLTDQVGAGAAGSSTRLSYDLSGMSQITPQQLLDSLYQTQTFFYCSEVPPNDAWGWNYEYYVNTQSLLASQAVAIRSPGRDGIWMGDVYPKGPFVMTNYNKDIVWADGLFVHYPAGLAVMDAVRTGP